KLWWHSPLKYADNFKTPILIIHADADYRCPMPDGLSMLTALKVRGVPSRMVLFHDETHELSRSGRPKGRIKRMEEILGWMDRYLKD
ncbi:MAG: prolyl oligopeptidase family serine peptidase, partial [Clostridia bacterium]|nr:prolyl oligopeptidase family serine peptidase [Clostridia bacterium]